jgi:hypothetical protein
VCTGTTIGAKPGETAVLLTGGKKSGAETERRKQPAREFNPLGILEPRSKSLTH